MTVEPWIASLVCGAAIGGAAGYLGSLMLSRKMALVADPLGHLTLPGVALALLAGIDVSIGAFPFVVGGVLVIWSLERRTVLSMEALTALVFATGVAVTFLFLPIDRAEQALVGDLAKVGVADAAVSVVGSAAVAIVVRRAYGNLVLCGISEDLAAAEGVQASRYDLLYLLAIAVVVALGVRVVGGLLTAALVAIPPAAARNIAKDLGGYASASAILGIASSALGVLLFRLTGAPAGPLIVLVSAGIFVCTLPFASRRAA